MQSYDNLTEIIINFPLGFSGDISKNYETTWSSASKGRFIKCNRDGQIEYVHEGDAKSNIRSESSIPSSVKCVCIEAKVESYTYPGDLDIGLITSAVGNDSLIGREKSVHGIGYCGHQGIIYHSGLVVGPVEKIKNGDTLGCELKRIAHKGSVYNICRFFRNGRYIGPPRCLEDAEYFPALAFNSEPSTVHTNLVYCNTNLDFLVDVERRRTRTTSRRSNLVDVKGINNF